MLRRLLPALFMTATVSLTALTAVAADTPATPATTGEAAAPARPATGAPIGIAAVVNDEPITKSDIENRLKLYMMGVKDAPEDAVARMRAQVFAKLIEERLQMQEAKKLGITVDKDQLKAGFDSIAQRNNVTTDVFRQKMADEGINPETLMDQLRGDIAWGQVIRRKLRPQINVTESEIDAAFDEMEKKGEAAPVAKADPAAPAEGEKPAQTAAEQTPAPATDQTAAPAAEQTAPPASATAAPQKVPFVALKQIVIPTAPDDPAEVLNGKMARAEALKKSVASCDDFTAKMKDFAGPGTLDMGRGPVSALPPALQKIIEGVAAGGVGGPVRLADGKGIALIAVCERAEEALPAGAVSAAAAPATLPRRDNQADREAVANKIGIDRLNKLADRYLRDLRATAFIDIKK